MFPCCTVLYMVLEWTDTQVFIVLHLFTAKCDLMEYRKLVGPQRFASIFL